MTKLTFLTLLFLPFFISASAFAQSSSPSVNGVEDSLYLNEQSGSDKYQDYNSNDNSPGLFSKIFNKNNASKKISLSAPEQKIDQNIPEDFSEFDDNYQDVFAEQEIQD